MADSDSKHADGADLEMGELPALSWSSEDTLASLEALYRRVERQALAAIRWYLAEKRSKARWSRFLRALSILFTISGGLVPLLGIAGFQVVDSAFGYVLLSLAAGSLGADRFFGLSAAWARYMSAAMALRRLLLRLQLEWSTVLATLEPQTISSADAEQAIEVLMAFTMECSTAVEEETQAWANEFGLRVAELERFRLGPT